ncbi:hypothetical protein KFK09_022064 [Dendrobium nobile]|uniref:Uncharacterized protein n=1 Tax=Dendrobium nobile TaxID=94219 RepID=A0A8T3AIB4_DENNO|nr:hypothetical protein KFK09_022064 [Dendrobium nobile]
MAGFFLSCFFFTVIFSTVNGAMALPGQLGLLDLGVLSPSFSAPEGAQRAPRHGSKLEVVTGETIAAGFAAAVVVAVFVYIWITRKRSAEICRY